MCPSDYGAGTTEGPGVRRALRSAPRLDSRTNNPLGLGGHPWSERLGFQPIDQQRGAGAQAVHSGRACSSRSAGLNVCNADTATSGSSHATSVGAARASSAARRAISLLSATARWRAGQLGWHHGRCGQRFAALPLATRAVTTAQTATHTEAAVKITIRRSVTARTLPTPASRMASRRCCSACHLPKTLDRRRPPLQSGSERAVVCRWKHQHPLRWLKPTDAPHKAATHGYAAFVLSDHG